VAARRRASCTRTPHATRASCTGGARGQARFGQRGRTAENVDEDQRGYERCGQTQRVLQRVRPDHSKDCAAAVAKAPNEGDHQWQSEAIIRFGAPPATSIAPNALKYSATSQAAPRRPCCRPPRRPRHRPRRRQARPRHCWLRGAPSWAAGRALRTQCPPWRQPQQRPRRRR
jgi:hypothetical protein